MNIDNMTYGELKQIATLFASATAATVAKPTHPMIGKKCVIRTNTAGVWFGEVTEKDGNEVIVHNARRLWRWFAKESISLSAVALHGIKHDKSLVAQAVPSVWLEAIELIPASDAGIASIEGAPNAEAQ